MKALKLGRKESGKKFAKKHTNNFWEFENHKNLASFGGISSFLLLIKKKQFPERSEGALNKGVKRMFFQIETNVPCAQANCWLGFRV